MSFWDKYLELCTNIDSNANAEAKKIGIASSTVSNWKTKGGSPQPHTLKKIAEHFGVDEDYFSEEAPEAEKAPMPNDIGEENILRMYRSLSTEEKGAWYAYAISLKEKQKEG